MSISLLDSVANSTTTAANTCVLPGGAPASGNLLVVQGVYDGADGNISLTGWTITTQVSYFSRRLVFGHRVADGTETASFAFVYSGGNVANTLVLTRWDGTWGANPFDVESTVSFSTSAATTTLTPTASESALLIAHIMNYQLNSCAPAASNTELHDAALPGGSNAQMWSGYRIVDPTSGGYTMGGTLSGGGFQEGGLRAISFIESAGGGGGARSQAVIIG